MERSNSTAIDEIQASTWVDKPLNNKSFFRKFCSSTSLHGFQYLVDNTRSALERICWVIAVCLSVLACTWLIFRIYMKWVNSPVIVSFADTTTAVRDIPFPAVTICSGNKIRKSVFDFKMVATSENSTEEEIDKLGYASLLCQFLAKAFPWNETVDERAVKFLEEAGTPLGDMIVSCSWRGKSERCSDIFTSVLTDAGLCYTFNAVRADELFTALVDPNIYSTHLNHSYNASSWTLEGGYTAPLEDSYPFRSAKSGSKQGLSFYYNQNTSELSDSCGFPGFGFKVLVHSPVDFPQVSTQYFRLPPEHDVVVGVEASMINTSVGLQNNLKPHQRQCFMSYERNLYYFKIYTAANCEFECFINSSLIKCNCSSFYMPSMYCKRW